MIEKIERSSTNSTLQPCFKNLVGATALNLEIKYFKKEKVKNKNKLTAH